MNAALRRDVDVILRSSLNAVLPDEAVRRALRDLRPGKGRVLLVAAGKAAWQMAHAAVEALGRVDGFVRQDSVQAGCDDGIGILSQSRVHKTALLVGYDLQQTGFGHGFSKAPPGRAVREHSTRTRSYEILFFARQPTAKQFFRFSAPLSWQTVLHHGLSLGPRYQWSDVLGCDASTLR